MDYARLGEEAKARLGTDGLGRIEEALRISARGDRAAGGDPLQIAKFLRIPGLTAKPWHDPRDLESFPWVPEVERAAGEVLEEFLALDRDVPAIDAGAGYDSAGEGTGWLGWFLLRGSEWNEPIASRCPRTRAILDAQPRSRGEAFFSEIRPGGIIPMHSGGCNGILSCHLALLVPDEAKIRVGMSTRGWRAGEVSIFDDSYVHMCWNDGAERRIVLAWEIWHPELTPREREAVGLLFDLAFA